MRSGEVINAVKLVTQTNSDNISWIIQSVTGGWEVWLQVQVIIALRQNMGVNGRAERETKYLHSREKCDILLKPTRGVDIYFEFKVQNAANDDILDRFENDIQKIRRAFDQYRRFIYVAVAYMESFYVPDLLAIYNNYHQDGAFKRWDFQINHWAAIDNIGQAPIVASSATLVAFYVDLD